MTRNRIQVQPAMSMPEFIAQYGTEARCEAEMGRVRSPKGFRWPRCGGPARSIWDGSPRQVFQLQCLSASGLAYQRQLDTGKAAPDNVVSNHLPIPPSLVFFQLQGSVDSLVPFL